MRGECTDEPLEAFSTTSHLPKIEMGRAPIGYDFALGEVCRAHCRDDVLRAFVLALAEAVDRSGSIVTLRVLRDAQHHLGIPRRMTSLMGSCCSVDALL